MSKFRIGDLVQIVADHSVNCGQICEVVGTAGGITVDTGIDSSKRPRLVTFKNQNSLRLHERKKEEKKIEESGKVFLAVMYAVSVHLKEEKEDVNQIKTLEGLSAYMANDLEDPTDVYVGTVDQIKAHAKEYLDHNELFDAGAMIIVFDNRIHLLYSKRETSFINLEKDSM